MHDRLNRFQFAQAPFFFTEGGRDRGNMCKGDLSVVGISLPIAVASKYLHSDIHVSQERPGQMLGHFPTFEHET